MILFGASGHGKVIYDILKNNDIVVTHFFDDNPNIKRFLDTDVSHYLSTLYDGEELIISVGNNVLRQKISKRVSHIFGIAIHQSSIISESVKVGLGTVIMHGAIVQTHSVLGNHVIVNTAASVDHDAIISDFVHISPNATLCGSVYVGEGTHIGAGAVVNPNIKIGKWCTIGSGSVIIKDVPDNVVVVGNPGKIIKYNTNIDEQ